MSVAGRGRVGALGLALVLASAADPPSLSALQEHRWALSVSDTVTRLEDGTPGRAWDIAVDSAGRVYVAGVAGVHAFSAAGEHLGPVGRRRRFGSAGSGDYAAPSAVGVTEDGIWVADGRSSRVLYFTRDGDPVDSWPVGREPTSTGDGTTWLPLGVLGEETVALLEWPEDLEALAGRESALRLVVADREGRPVRELPPVDPANALMAATARPAYRLLSREPFAFSDMVDVAPSGGPLVVLSRPRPEGPDSAAYTLTAYGPHGSVRWEARRPYRPLPLTDEAFDRWVEKASTGRDSDRPADFYRRLFRENTYRPEFRPPVPNEGSNLNVLTGPLAFGRDGSVWIERTASSEGSLWDVFDAEGEFAGTARGPEDLHLMVVSGDAAWGILNRTEEGALRQSVVRLEVR